MKLEQAMVSRPIPIPHVSWTAASDPDAALVAQAREGNEAAFAELVERYHSAMIRVASTYVPAALAEEVAQESWIAVMRGLERFQGRSKFKTWLFRVLINRALTHAAHEARASRLNRNLTFPSCTDDEPLDVSHFYADDHQRAGQWLVPPAVWTPEDRLMTTQTLEYIERELVKLPALQRQILVLRDVEGWTSREVCDLFGMSENHQRVTLHRARTRLRNALDKFLSGEKR